MEEFEHSEALKRALRMADGDTMFRVKPFDKLPVIRYDHILAEGCETWHPQPLSDVLHQLIYYTRKSLLVIVPLSERAMEPYLLPEDNIDPDSVIKWPLDQWLSFIQDHVQIPPTWSMIITGSWHYPGLRPASSQVPKSTGFIQFTRI